MITLKDFELEEEKNLEFENLRVKLAKTQQKVVMMTFTIKRIYRVMKSLIDRLREAIKLIKTINKDAIKSNQNKLLAFAKENIIRVNEILQLLN